MRTAPVIGHGDRDLESVGEELRSTTLNSIRGVLPDATILAACREAGYTFRRRVLTPVVTVLHMVLAALWPEESFAASWTVIWSALVSRRPGAAGQSPTSGSVAKARGRLPFRVWTGLFGRLSHQAQRQAARFEAWRGHRVVLLDGATFSMPDGPELMAAFGTTTRKGKPGAYPLGRLVAFSVAGAMVVIDYAIGAYRRSEIALARPLLKHLRKGDLLIADRFFAGAHLYADFLVHGVQFLTRIHQRRRVDGLKPVTVHGPGDVVVVLPIGRKYQRATSNRRAFVLVRLIRVSMRIRGKRKLTWLVTSLLDAERYPAREVVALYARRWRIETLFRELKVALDADVLRSKTVAGIRAEMAARLCAVNIVRTIMLQAAEAGGVDPLRVSFAHALRTILVFAPAMGTAPLHQVPAIYQAMLCEIAAHLNPQRPGRNEPRLVRRQPQRYPTLRTTRAEWRRNHAA